MELGGVNFGLLLTYSRDEEAEHFIYEIHDFASFGTYNDGWKEEKGKGGGMRRIQFVLIVYI